MKNTNLVSILILIMISMLSLTTTVIAQTETTVSPTKSIWPPSHYIGTLQSYLDDLQRLPGIIDESICAANDAGYQEKMALLQNRIEGISSLMVEMGLKIPSTVNLRIIQTTITKNKICGVGKIATGYADLAREKLDAVIRNAGLYNE
ncbi:hypothetical protein [Flexilinea flocculi]|jgi:hypothetical protein|uniref:Uncharacterized protein n=1 Tax=Flexilinea flocculi TaxID=1678840 RepID=A0A0K8PBW8_9CHLR|nr:hypothetical protein [Flexilinea flocculi]NMB93758.1 hypothetical protein [Flexilinea flocculi]GAP39645.1 hypothetical protein ATC1_12179 [Flexilinea flocculi]